MNRLLLDAPRTMRRLASYGSCLPYWPVEWRLHALWLCRLIAFAIALALGSHALPATAQDKGGPGPKTYEYTLGSMRFRVPSSYMRPSADPTYVYNHLYFAYWLSDAKPIGSDVPPMGTRERSGRGWYWPPEPGRPFFSSEDFLVFVLEALPMGQAQGLARQEWPREPVGPRGGVTRNEDGLSCRSYQTGRKHCFTPIGSDPDVSMSLNIWPDNVVWTMTFYSRADSMWVKLDFPGLGQSRWSDVICRTLQLIRSWRISEGPPPPDCQSARLASLYRPENWL